MFFIVTEQFQDLFNRKKKHEKLNVVMNLL